MKAIDWNKIPSDADVIDTGKSYVAIINGTKHLVIWSSFNAVEAQRELNRRAKKTAKGKK